MNDFLPPPEPETSPQPTDSTSVIGTESMVSEELDRVDEAKSETAATAIWQPKWLRPIVLVSFATLFVVFALVLSLLLWYSQRHDGVVAARQSFVYIWRFGPTAVFIQSIKQEHHLLSLVIVTSIILTAQIALAPGLFSLATVRAEYDVSIQTLDSFDTEKYANASEIPQETSAFYNVRAIRDFDMAYPFGVNDELAYQTFRSRGDKSDGSRGTVREPLKAVVDGLFAEVQCLEYTFDVELYFEGCDKAISVEYEWNPPPRPRKSGQWMIDNELSPERSCSSLPQKNKQFVYYAAQLGSLVKNSSSPPWPVIGKAAAVICTSAAWLSKVEVSDDGISPNVTLISNEEKTPIAANPWDLVSKATPHIFSVNGYDPETTEHVDDPVSLDWLRDGAANTSDSSLYENDILLNSTKKVVQVMIPFLGHYIIREKGGW
ncbi:hypothetical protein COL26b_009556 [Colletotrichum chrysophilum]|uniref:uncharacterized protein n=1 Tax=Colletotrichum chrysophilum TaxID=1836956 RepID=UPI0022FFFE13|nr:uncharacterized protein COL26b_009556 [Colletotrichum chrysophilum]KAJ0371571.1 hypothetical protein COL26b_009556 [Colletotrichum chrysophilum]